MTDDSRSKVTLYVSDTRSEKCKALSRLSEYHLRYTVHGGGWSCPLGSWAEEGEKVLTIAMSNVEVKEQDNCN